MYSNFQPPCLPLETNFSKKEIRYKKYVKWKCLNLTGNELYHKGVCLYRMFGVALCPLSPPMFPSIPGPVQLSLRVSSCNFLRRDFSQLNYNHRFHLCFSEFLDIKNLQNLNLLDTAAKQVVFGVYCDVIFMSA